MLNKSLIQGSLSMLILRLLDEKDMYGYEMIETLRKRSENVFELKAGSLYPLLHALEANNLVTAYEDDASGKMRKYYHITGEGKRILKEKWHQVVKCVKNAGMKKANMAERAGREYIDRLQRIYEDSGRTDSK